jgi:phage terminase Nu1 subunit (DNA packaging protein)
MVDGHVKISDPELADEEWESTTRPATGMPPGELGGDIPDLAESIARRAAAAARKEAAQAELAELELAEREGSVVEVARVRADVISKFTLVKSRILSVPARVAQRLPRIGSEVVSLIDDLLREALEELATDDHPAAGDVT